MFGVLISDSLILRFAASFFTVARARHTKEETDEVISFGSFCPWQSA